MTDWSPMQDEIEFPLYSHLIIVLFTLCSVSRKTIEK